MTPRQRYQLDLDENRLTPDPAQLAAVECLHALHQRLTRAAARKTGFLQRGWERLRGPARRPVKGAYLWGGVGRGKTRLVDMFYECLPMDNKLRVHFHRYMQWTHAELKQLKDTERPLQKVAAKLSREVAVICFDEFHVSDITDAMLLSGLFHALFERGVTLVATSNARPDDLYRGGLQRERFLPAIELIKRHADIIHLDAGTDYRLRHLDRGRTYHHPLDAAGRDALAASFERVAPDAAGPTTIEIEGRRIEAKRLASGVAWFDFSALCEGPRGVADYIEIARQFQTVFIDNAPRMDDGDNDRARRFVTLVDEFYDRNVKLIMTAEAGIKDLYAGRRLAGEYERAASRLVEMQSRDYLSRPHLPA